jgi:molybdate transport system substrate-binding protein
MAQPRRRNIRRCQAFNRHRGRDFNKGRVMRIRANHMLATLFGLALALPATAQAETIKVLTAGAFKQVMLAMMPQFQAMGHDVQWETDTVGGLVKKIEAGETFDVVFASPAALQGLHKAGKTGDSIAIARVGVGVAVKEGAAKPALATVEDFRQALLAARAVAYIDPASGGSSGIYVAGLLDKLGIGARIRPKSVLVMGGHAADRIVTGEADLAVHQISEILPVKGVTLVGPLPAEIQNYTIYAGAPSAGTTKAATVQALIELLRSKQGGAAMAGIGMEPIAH